MLALVDAALGPHARRLVDQRAPDCVLFWCCPPGPPVLKCCHSEVAVLDDDLDVVGQFRQHVHGGERRLPRVAGAERADADEPVDADLALHVAVGVRPDDLERDALQAGLEVRLLVHVLDREAVPLGPARVGAEEDLGPVAGVGPAGARLDRHDRGGAVVLAAHHRLELERLVLLLGLRERGLDLGLERRVLLGELGHRPDLAGGGVEFLVGLEQEFATFS